MKRINDIQAWMGVAALCLSSCPLSAQQVVPTGEPVLSWQDSTQLKVAFSVAAGGVDITSDDRLILTPRLTTKAGDTLTLPPVELAGKRNRRYFDRRAALRGEERAAVAAAADTLYYNKVVGVEPWMRASALSLTVDCGCARFGRHALVHTETQGGHARAERSRADCRTRTCAETHQRI